MAQLKDLLVSGVSRFVGKLFADEVQLTTLNIPTASNGTTYGPGTSGQVLATNNNSVYWKSLTIADIGGSTVLPVSLGGTGATVATKGGVVYGTGTTYSLTAAGTSGYLLQSGGTGAPTWINATNANTASTIVKRDASGNFSAGTITATLSGNASTANALNFSHSNELFLGVNGTNQTRVWINYRRTIGGATSGNTAITEYRFGNGNAGTSGVTLYADSFSGNAATATAFSSGATVTLTGDVTGQSAASTKSWSIATTLKNSGATAGSYGQSAAATLAHSGKFKVPYITVDAKGIVTSISEKEITLPASGNTDANVSQTITTGDADYRILFSGTADDTTRTEGARKGTNLRYNPSTSEIKMVNGTLWIQGGSNAGSSSATNRLTLTNGMPANLAYNTSKRGTRIYSNGIAFADPYNGNSNNDSGWIRQIEETGNSGTLEIATGDDSNEAIVVRQYNTSSAVTGEITLLNSSHQTLLNTTLPRANATYDLGSSSVKWSNVYATNFKGTADSALTANKLGTNAGSATQPVYFDGGIPKAATAYSGLLTAFSLSTNTLSLTVGGTTKTTSAVSSVSNTWANATTSGPTIKTTVNGVAGSAVAIPSASASASGIITTGPQTIAGDKTFDSQMTVIGHNVIRSDTQGPDQGDILLGALGFKTGYPVYTDPTLLSGNNSIGVYNNTSGGNVVHTRDTYTNFGITSPGTNSNYVIRIQTKGAASPGIGGFVQGISSRANAVFIQIFRALIPVGRNVQTASNAMGTSYRDQWLTSQAGTGKWEWYARRVICGKEGTFSSGGHVYLDGAAGTSDAPVTWYLAACNVYDITRMEYDGLRTRYSDSATSATTASKSTAANITTTTNGVVYYTNTTGVFGNRASANGALYATSANGALQWGTLPIAQGGTSLTSNPSLLVNLGSTDAATIFQASPRPGITGTLPVAHGGTGSTTAAGARANLGTWSLISDSYNTIMPADGTTNGWYKFGTSNTSYGILPSASGGAGSGHNYIGTSSWYWKYAYIDEIHGTLKGNADTATTATTATTANKLGTTAVGSITQPVYWANGIPTIANAYTWRPLLIQQYQASSAASLNPSNTPGSFTLRLGRNLFLRSFDLMMESGNDNVNYGATIEGLPLFIGTQTTNTGAWKGDIDDTALNTQIFDDGDLYTGLTIKYFLPYAGSGNATLQLFRDGAAVTSAIPCYYNEGRLTTHYGRGSVITFTYFKAGDIKINGTPTADNRWIADANYADGNDVNRSTITYPRIKTGAVGIGRYQLFMETSDGTYQSVTSTFNSTGTTHVKNTALFKPNRVFYSNRGSDIPANNTADTGTSWMDQQTSLIDLRYSTNCGTSLTTRAPVYLVGTIDDNGYLTLADTWYTQTLPTSADGKVYIYLGQVYNDTNGYRVAFELDNPILEYRAGAIREYSAPTRVLDYNNKHAIEFGYSTAGMTSTSWVGSWDGYKLRAISPANLRNSMGLGNSTGTLPIANGGTGLTASPSMIINLSSNTADLVLKANPKPGVEGVLGAANGGTGKTNLKDACNALINALDTGSSALTANDYVITQYVGGGTTTTTYHRRPASAIRVGGLLTGRSLKVALNSTTAVTFNGTADVDNIPVTGTLGIANGGTGQTTAAGVFSALSWTGGTSAGPTLSVTVVGQSRTATIPSASASASGVITTGAQTIAGAKTLSSTLTIKGLKATSGTDYGTTLPTSGTEGQVFFQISDEQYEIPIGGNTGTLLMKASATDRDVTWTPSAIHVTGSVLYGAAWNDYAEYRKTETKIEAGRVVVENGDDTLSLSTKRMQPGAEIVSDTFGFAIGQTKNTQTPIAVSGRVLAYPNEPRESYKPGQPVCSGPNGTVSQMTNEEAREYPWLIIGTVSAIPDYDTWGEDNIKINGRIWIRIR